LHTLGPFSSKLKLRERRTMTKTLSAMFLSVSFLVGASACGGNAIDEVKKWKEAACKCEDKACAEKQAKAFWTLAEKFKDEKPSKDDEKKLDELADAGQECLKKLEVDVYDMK